MTSGLKGSAWSRHSLRMKLLLCVPLLAALSAWAANEAADRNAIERTIAALNEYPQRPGLFTADADGTAIVRLTAKGKRLLYRRRWPAATPSVTISHEPWGEATINLPGTPPAAVPETVDSRIESRSIRFVAPDVALAEGVCLFEENGATVHTDRLLFVMKKESDGWKIASVRRISRN